jgi:hypothetical protein
VPHAYASVYPCARVCTCLCGPPGMVLSRGSCVCVRARVHVHVCRYVCVCVCVCGAGGSVHTRVCVPLPWLICSFLSFLSVALGTCGASARPAADPPPNQHAQSRPPTPRCGLLGHVAALLAQEGLTPAQLDALLAVASAVPTPASSGAPPLVVRVNPRQYHRILIRRRARLALLQCRDAAAATGRKVCFVALVGCVGACK